MTHLMVLLGLIASGVGLLVFSRRRRASGMDPRAAWEALKAGAPVTSDVARGVGRYFARHARPTIGIVEQVMSPDRYGVLLQDGTRITGTRAKRLWQFGVVLQPGQRVSVLMIPGDDHGTITVAR